MTGLLPTILELFEEEGVKVILNDQRRSPRKVLPKIPKLEGLRDYQKRGIKLSHGYARGLVDAATNAGKTNIIIGIVRRVRCPSLVLVRNADPVKQLYENFSKHFDQSLLGQVRGGVFQPNIVTVATVQSVYKLDKKFFEPFECLLFDECDEATSRTSKLTIRRMTRAYYRIGLSATALKKDAIRNMTLTGLFGPKLLEVSQKELVERGISCQARIEFYKVEQPDLKKASYDDAHWSGIVGSEIRNKSVVGVTQDYVREGRAVFVVVDKRDHGELIVRELEDLGISAVYVHGGIKSKKRWSYYERLGRGIDVIVGTKVLNRALNLPLISGIVNAAGGYADTNTLQRLGRGLRQKSEPMNPPLRVADFMDGPNKYLRLHSKRRKKTYKKEEIFDVVDLQYKYRRRYFTKAD
jgi:superfamily II DNA or RNA helicase